MCLSVPHWQDREKTGQKKISVFLSFIFLFTIGVVILVIMASARGIENGGKGKAKLEAADLPPDLLLHIFSHQTPSG
jgi:hypothetical protein